MLFTVLVLLLLIPTGVSVIEASRQLGLIDGAFWRNLPSIHHRALAWFLRRRGWVVFYLEDEQRHCSALYPSCWLALYNEQEVAARRARERQVCSDRERLSL